MPAPRKIAAVLHGLLVLVLRERSVHFCSKHTTFIWRILWVDLKPRSFG